MTTIASVFSGGEGVGTGAREAGIAHLYGIEYKADIAAVAELNGFRSIVADFLTVDPRTLEVPDILHASPVCKNASIANANRGETQWDIDCGQHIAHFIDVMRPKIFTLENVYQYRDFEAFGRIKAALNRGGYMYDYDNLNSADYGVPQTRRRLILRATRVGMLPNLPNKVPWVGWYAAIEDLIPTLPESKFAPWQLARLPQELTSFISDSLNYSSCNPNRLPVEPLFTLTIYSAKHPSPRAFIMSDGGNTNFEEAYPGRGVRNADEPRHIVSAGDGGFTPKAFIITGGNASNPEPARFEHEPVQTVTSNSKATAGNRAWLSSGRVVAMTPRALARFQSIPDSYILPENKRLACTIIGNAVPPKLYETIIRHLANGLE